MLLYEVLDRLQQAEREGRHPKVLFARPSWSEYEAYFVSFVHRARVRLIYTQVRVGRPKVGRWTTATSEIIDVLQSEAPPELFEWLR